MNDRHFLCAASNVYLDTKLISKCVNSIILTALPHVATLLTGCVLEPRLCCETTSRDMFWSYIIMVNLFIVLLIEYVSSIRSSI